MLLKNLGYSTKELSKEGFKGISSKITDYKKLSEELGIGEITLKDIVKELEKPGRDPREDLPKPILRTDVLEMKDLKPGMKLKGTVRNVIDLEHCRYWSTSGWTSTHFTDGRSIYQTSIRSS